MKDSLEEIINLVNILNKAALHLNDCEEHFEQFYKAAMACYGVYYQTLAFMNMYPNMGYNHINKRAKGLCNKFEHSYK